MSSPNRAGDHRFTYEYAQTLGYRFCQDSVIFPRFIAAELRARAIDASFRVLDLCSGSGVIGLELAYHDARIQAIDFLEIQAEFKDVFSRNLEITGRDRTRFRFLNESFSVLAAGERSMTYDLIVANPPYFVDREGQLSGSRHQDRCRFFLDGSLRELVLGVANALRRNGDAYLLVKSGLLHGRDSLREIKLWLAGAALDARDSACSAEIVADIRGTNVVRIRRAN